jgi:hypothetical protein
LSGSISRDSSTSNSQQTTHHNTSLTATNINLNTTQNTKRVWHLVVLMSFGGFFVLKIVVLFLMRGWGYIFTIKG